MYNNTDNGWFLYISNLSTEEKLNTLETYIPFTYTVTGIHVHNLYLQKILNGPSRFVKFKVCLSRKVLIWSELFAYICKLVYTLAGLILSTHYSCSGCNLPQANQTPETSHALVGLGSAALSVVVLTKVGLHLPGWDNTRTLVDGSVGATL